MAMLVLFSGGQYVEPSNLGLDLICGEIDDRIGEHIPAGYRVVSDLASEAGFDVSVPSACDGGGGDVCE